MRSLQFIGFVAAMLAACLGYVLLYPLDAEAPASAAGAAGLGLMFGLGPVLGLSAVLLVPSTIALLWPEVRRVSQFHGRFWIWLWAVNGMLSLAYLLVAAYAAYLWFSINTAS